MERTGTKSFPVPRSCTLGTDRMKGGGGGARMEHECTRSCDC